MQSTYMVDIKAKMGPIWDGVLARRARHGFGGIYETQAQRDGRDEARADNGFGGILETPAQRDGRAKLPAERRAKSGVLPTDAM